MGDRSFSVISPKLWNELPLIRPTFQGSRLILHLVSLLLNVHSSSCISSFRPFHLLLSPSILNKQRRRAYHCLILFIPILLLPFPVLFFFQVENKSFGRIPGFVEGNIKPLLIHDFRGVTSLDKDWNKEEKWTECLGSTAASCGGHD